jgi:hypothetical protein
MQRPLKKFTSRNKNYKKSSNNLINNDFLKRTVLSLKISGRPFVRKLSSIQGKVFVTFHIYPNNIFCTYKILDNTKFIILNKASSGKYKINISKKTLRFKMKFVINSFLNELKQKDITLNNSIIKLIAPFKLKKSVIGLISEDLKNKSFFIHTDPKKVFNGCRSKKKLRKKRKKLKLFK